MIEGLYRIDWTRLTHAHGPAMDIPGLLLGLLSPDSEERDHAFSLLEGRIWDQGLVFEAAAPVIPFLIQLVQNPLVAGRTRLLLLLTRLANGVTAFDFLPGADFPDLDLELPEFSGRLALEPNWARAARREVRKGIPAYLWCLEQPDPDVRSAGAYLLACFVGDTGRLSGSIIRRLGREHNPIVKASLVLALGVALAFDPVLIELLEDIHRREYPPLVRLASALAIVRHTGNGAPPVYMESLIDHLSHPAQDLAAQYGRLPWAEGHMYADIALALCIFGPSRGGAILPDLVRSLDRVESVATHDIAYAMLYLAFGKRVWSGGGPDGLAQQQCMVLEALADCQHFWQFELEAQAILSMFGLPQAPEGIRGLLAGAA